MAERFTMVAPFGYLATPGFPDRYPNNSNATCLVTSAKSGENVEVSIVHVALPVRDDCRDSLDITRLKVVTRLCNAASRQSAQARFRAPAILVNFQSDEADSSAGIWLHFRGIANIGQ